VNCGEADVARAIAAPSSPAAFLPLSALRGAAREAGLEPPAVGDRVRFMEELLLTAIEMGAADKLLALVDALYRAREESLVSRLESSEEGPVRAKLEEGLRAVRSVREKIRELRGCLSGALSL
jgi:hypothetical protein